jgi:hypothetical protein
MPKELLRRLEHERLLAAAEAELTALRRTRIVSPERGFLDAAAANSAALMLLDTTRGPILSREWTSI